MGRRHQQQRSQTTLARIVGVVALLLLCVHWLVMSGSANEEAVKPESTSTAPQDTHRADDAATTTMSDDEAPIARSRFANVEWHDEYRTLMTYLEQRHAEGRRAAGPERFLFPLLRYGPNNQFLCLMQVVKLAKDTRRTLVLPKLQAWQNDRATTQLVWPFETVFDTEALRKAVDTVPLDDFVRRVAGQLDVLMLPKLDYMKYDRQRTLESLRNNGLEVGPRTVELDNEHMGGEGLRVQTQRPVAHSHQTAEWPRMDC